MRCALSVASRFALPTPRIQKGDSGESTNSSASRQIQVFLSEAPRPSEYEDSVTKCCFPSDTRPTYGFLMCKLRDALVKLSISCTQISNPEYVPSAKALSGATTTVHFNFSPPNGIRLLKGAYNVVVMPWGLRNYAETKRPSSSANIDNPGRLLSLANEVWSLSNFGADSIRRSVSNIVRAIPMPILQSDVPAPRSIQPHRAQGRLLSNDLASSVWTPLGIAPHPEIMQSVFEAAERRGRRLDGLLSTVSSESQSIVFLSILDVQDPRKQIGPLLEAFLQFLKTYPKAYLLLKLSLTSSARSSLNLELYTNQIKGRWNLENILVSNRILLNVDPFETNVLGHLYDLSDFYVSTSHGEGLNIPLINAMNAGCVPISVDHTAMRDYICDENAVIIQSSVAASHEWLKALYGLQDLETYHSSANEILEALLRAALLPCESYASMSRVAQQSIRQHLSIQSFSDKARGTFDTAVHGDWDIVI